MSRSLFFARCPPAVPYDNIHSLFKQYGPVKRLNLYRRWATAKTSKGCGIVEFEDVESAAAAVEALSGKYTFEGFQGGETAIVLEPMDPARMTAAATGKQHGVLDPLNLFHGQLKPACQPKTAQFRHRSLIPVGGVAVD
jgi:hypothetical protein